MNLEVLGNILFPPQCVVCKENIARGALCGTCRSEVVTATTFFCGRCRARLPDAKKICHPGVPYMLAAAGEYGDAVLRTLIHVLKFNGIKSAALSLGEILAEYAAALPINITSFTVVPLPLSKQRRRARGFNQSELIAQRFANQRGLPLEKNMLARVNHRKPQSETESRGERKENIKGCFLANSEIAQKYPNILLVDDVTTSGATFTEAARALKDAGAKKIIALAVAKV